MSTTGQKKTFGQLSKHHRNQSRRHWTFSAADPLAPPAVAAVHEEEKEERAEKPTEYEEMQVEPPDTTMTLGAQSPSRSAQKKQEATSVKKRLTTKSPTEKRTATFADEPVKRRLTGKTDTKNDDLLTRVEIEDSCLVNTVNTLLSDESGAKTNPNDDCWQAEIVTILAHPQEVKKGRQKELNSLREMGVMTAVTRSSAACKRVILTRWVDRERDGCVKSGLVLKDFNRDQGRTQSEMFAPTPSTLFLKTMLAVSSHDRNNHPERDNIAISIVVHTAFLHADIDQELIAEPPAEPELCKDAVGNCTKRCMDIAKHRNCGTNML